MTTLRLFVLAGCIAAISAVPDVSQCGRTWNSTYCKTDSKQSCNEKCQQFDYDSGACDDTNAACKCFHPICENGEVNGDPMYVTFDGTNYWAHDEVRHLLVKPLKTSKDVVPDFRVFHTNECVMGDCLNKVAYHWSRTRSIELHVYGKQIVVTLNDRGERFIEVNGRPTDGPYIFEKDHQFVSVHRLGVPYWYRRRCTNSKCGGVLISTDFGIKIVIHGYWRILNVLIPPTKEFKYNIAGALGNLDGSSSNDMMYPNGQVAAGDRHNRDDFLWAWNITRTTGKLRSRVRRRFECHGRLLRERDQRCEADFDRIFADCLTGPYIPRWMTRYLKMRPQPSWVPRNLNYYNTWMPKRMKQWADQAKEQCKADFCFLDKPSDPIENGACDAYATFEQRCSNYKYNAKIGDYRSSKFCPLECEAPHSHYEQCAACQPTCRLSNKKKLELTCGDPCIAGGCLCDKGYVYDEDTGNCVHKGKCSR